MDKVEMFLQKIRCRRRDLGMTQKDVANMIGTPYSAYARFEGNSLDKGKWKTKISVDEIVNLLEFLDVSIGDSPYTVDEMDWLYTDQRIIQLNKEKYKEFRAKQLEEIVAEHKRKIEKAEKELEEIRKMKKDEQ